MPDYYTRHDEGGAQHVILQGDWTAANGQAIRQAVRQIQSQPAAVIRADTVEHMDLWGALQIQALAEQNGSDLFLNDKQRRLFDFMPMGAVAPPVEPARHIVYDSFVMMGQMAQNAAHTAYELCIFIGQIAACFVRSIARPRGFRFHSIVRHIEETGLRALPIIGMLAILISMVISYQAATQLQRFGASIFTVDLTVISLLREMGVLVTAIMVAGRSGSAFAAEIGVMKLREEIDALKTMGFDPIELLVLPRLIAMLITLPILAFLADIMGLIGGGLISIILLDIPLDQYIERVAMVAKPTMFFVGLIKAPVFAFVITIIGTYQGLNVSGSAESVGRLTTVAVVQSIFLVIMVDALFSIIFSNLGI